MSALQLMFRALLPLAVLATHVRAQDSWAVADSATVREHPSRFVSLPLAVRNDLESRGCRIPQVSSHFGERSIHNAVKGAFTAPNRQDWAVLCSIRDTSRILVYRGDHTALPDSIAKAADRSSLQILNEEPGYSRLLARADSARIRRIAREFNGRAPPGALDHEGIEDIFVGKASVIFYFVGGRWIRLQGVD